MNARIRAAIVLTSVFLAGVVSGVFIDRHWSDAATHAPATPAEMHVVAMSELTEELDLSDEQITAIHGLMAERQQLVQRTWEQLRPEVQEAMRQLHGDIAELLRPDQRERFHQWLTAQRERSQPRHR